jgi:hypothetical protein
MCSMQVHLRPIVAEKFSMLVSLGEFAEHGTGGA